MGPLEAVEVTVVVVDMDQGGLETLFKQEEVEAVTEESGKDGQRILHVVQDMEALDVAAVHQEDTVEDLLEVGGLQEAPMVAALVVDVSQFPNNNVEQSRSSSVEMSQDKSVQLSIKLNVEMCQNNNVEMFRNNNAKVSPDKNVPMCQDKNVLNSVSQLPGVKCVTKIFFFLFYFCYESV